MGDSLTTRYIDPSEYNYEEFRAPIIELASTNKPEKKLDPTDTTDTKKPTKPEPNFGRTDMPATAAMAQTIAGITNVAAGVIANPLLPGVGPSLFNAGMAQTNAGLKAWAKFADPVVTNVNAPKIVEGLALQDNTTRDRAEAGHHLLDGQIDALGRDKNGNFNGTGNTFIHHQEGDQKYLAYKSDYHGSGDVRYGKAKIGADGKLGAWENVAENDKLRKELDKVHDAHMKDVKEHGTIENYREAEKLRRDITELSGANLSQNPEGAKALNDLGVKLDDLRDGKKDSEGKVIQADTLTTQFNDLLNKNQDLKNIYLDNRLNHLDGNKESPHKDSAKKVAPRTDSKVLIDGIDKFIDKYRDDQQALNNKDDAEKLKTDMAALREKFKKLPEASTDPKTESLRQASKNLLASYDTGSTATQGKYMQGELAYLHSKLDALGETTVEKKAATTPPKSDDPAFKADREAYRKMYDDVIKKYPQFEGKTIILNKDDRTNTLTINDMTPKVDPVTNKASGSSAKYEAKIDANGNFSDDLKKVSTWTQPASAKPVEPTNSLDTRTLQERFYDNMRDTVIGNFESTRNLNTEDAQMKQENDDRRSQYMKAFDDNRNKILGLQSGGSAKFNLGAGTPDIAFHNYNGKLYYDVGSTGLGALVSDYAAGDKANGHLLFNGSAVEAKQINLTGTEKLLYAQDPSSGSNKVYHIDGKKETLLEPFSNSQYRHPVHNRIFNIIDGNVTEEH